MNRISFPQYAESVACDPTVRKIVETVTEMGMSEEAALRHAARIKLALDEQAIADLVGRDLSRSEEQSIHIRLLRGVDPLEIAQVFLL